MASAVNEDGEQLYPRKWNHDFMDLPIIVDQHTPTFTSETVSCVAATLLANPGLPSQNAYALISETPTVKEMTEALGRVIGRPIRYVAVTDEQWANAVKEQVNPHALDHLTHLWQNFRKGEERYQTTDAIRMVTGRNPQTLEEFFRENDGFFVAGSP